MCWIIQIELHKKFYFYLVSWLGFGFKTYMAWIWFLLLHIYIDIDIDLSNQKKYQCYAYCVYFICTSGNSWSKEWLLGYFHGYCGKLSEIGSLCVLWLHWDRRSTIDKERSSKNFIFTQIAWFKSWAEVLSLGIWLRFQALIYILGWSLGFSPTPTTSGLLLRYLLTLT